MPDLSLEVQELLQVMCNNGTWSRNNETEGFVRAILELLLKMYSC